MSDTELPPAPPPREPDLFPEQEDEVVTTREPLTARRVALVGGRFVAGVVGLGVAAVTVAASVLIPLPTVSSTPPSTLVTPVPTAQQQVCPGAVLRLADDTGQGATTSSALGTPTTSAASSSGWARAADWRRSTACPLVVTLGCDRQGPAVKHRFSFRAAWPDWSPRLRPDSRARDGGDSGRAFPWRWPPSCPPRSPANRAWSGSGDQRAR